LSLGRGRFSPDIYSVSIHAILFLVPGRSRAGKKDPSRSNPEIFLLSKNIVILCRPSTGISDVMRKVIACFPVLLSGNF